MTGQSGESAAAFHVEEAGQADESAGARPPAHLARLLAFVLDVAAVAFPMAVLALLGRVTGVGSVRMYATVLGVVFTYYTATSVWLTDGQTIGKTLCNLKVRRIDGGAILRTPRGFV